MTRFLPFIPLLLAGCALDTSVLLQEQDAETILVDAGVPQRDGEIPDSGISVPDSGISSPDAGPDAQVEPDSGTDAGREADAGLDAGTDAGADSGSSLGGFGDYCTSVFQCESGLCDLNDNFCTRDCTVDRFCPSGYTCVDLPGTSPPRATCRR